MFIRIQHKTIPSGKRTIFKGGIYYAWYNAARGAADNVVGLINSFLYGPAHPSLLDDELLVENARAVDALDVSNNVDGYVFGFADVAQLKEWFPDSFLKDAQEIGFEAVRFKGDVIKGDKQALIKVDTAKFIRRYSLTSI